MNKMQIIDELLKDDCKLEKYIDDIEKTQIQKPENIDKKILSKINKNKKTKFADICKIAACLVFSLSLCRTDLIKNDDIKIYEEQKTKTSISIQISEKLSDFCKWAITPIEKED